MSSPSQQHGQILSRLLAGLKDGVHNGALIAAVLTGLAYPQYRLVFYCVLIATILWLVWASRLILGRPDRLALPLGRLVGIVVAWLLRPPRTYARRLAATALLFAFVVPLLVWLGWAAVDDLHAAGPTKMSGEVNVLVATFGEHTAQGLEASETTHQMSAWLATALKDRFATQIGERAVEVRQVSTVVEEGEEQALELAAQHGADVVVYGEALDLRDAKGLVITLRFALTGEGAGDISSADLAELAGENALGSPLGPVQREDILQATSALSARAELVVTFSAGLVCLLSRDDAAVEVFQRAIRLSQDQGFPDNEVLHLFLGKAYDMQNVNVPHEPALQEYEAAIALNPEYARPYVGVGNWYYLTGAAARDARLLRKAIEYYQGSIAASLRPPNPIPLAKSRLSLGNAYVVLAQIDDARFATHAQHEYRAALALQEPCEGGLGWWDPRGWGPWRSWFESRPPFCEQLDELIHRAQEGLEFVGALQQSTPSPPSRSTLTPTGTRTVVPTPTPTIFVPTPPPVHHAPTSTSIIYVPPTVAPTSPDSSPHACALHSCGDASYGWGQRFLQRGYPVGFSNGPGGGDR